MVWVPTCLLYTSEMFINFMCETDIGKANAEYIGYTTPMQDVWEVLAFSSGG